MFTHYAIQDIQQIAHTQEASVMAWWCDGYNTPMIGGDLVEWDGEMCIIADVFVDDLLGVRVLIIGDDFEIAVPPFELTLLIPNMWGE